MANSGGSLDHSEWDRKIKEFKRMNKIKQKITFSLRIGYLA